MVYTTALLFGHKLSSVSEEESVVEMIGKYFSQLASPARSNSSSRRGSVESCEDRDYTSPAAADLDAGLEEEQRDVTRGMERALTEAKASALHCQVLLLPRQLTSRVGRDVVRSSADEPCGLRGASIKVYVERADGVMKAAGGVRPDPSVTPTFELSVIFRAHRRTMFESSRALKLRPEYRLVKRKLYSSASPVIHDFN